MMYYQFNSNLVSTEQQPFIQQLLDCKDFTHSDRLLGSSTGRGITWFLKTEQEIGVNSVKRHYYRGGLFGKIIKDHYWFSGIERSRPAQEFQLLMQLHQWGLPVPQPIAFKLTRHWGCYQGDILLEKIADTQDLSQYLQQQALNDEAYQRIGQLIRQLHNHQVHHSDLNIHNILLDQQNTFWLIDFDKCQIQKGDEWKQGNLDRLLRSFHKEQKRLHIHFSDQNWQALLKGYHQ